MWKVGDKVRFIANGYINCVEEEGFVIDDIYEIIKTSLLDANDDGEVFEEDQPLNRDGYKYAIRHQDLTWWIEVDCFKKVKKLIPKNEIDYLDCFKFNFQNGY